MDDFWQRTFYFLGRAELKHDFCVCVCVFFLLLWLLLVCAVIFLGATCWKSPTAWKSRSAAPSCSVPALFLDTLTHTNQYRMVCLVVAVVHFCCWWSVFSLGLLLHRLDFIFVGHTHTERETERQKPKKKRQHKHNDVTGGNYCFLGLLGSRT